MRRCFLLCMLLCFAAANVPAASFDCKKAKTEIEMMICSDNEISKLDEEMDRAYKNALASVSYKEELKTLQREWVKSDRNTCKDSRCLRTAYLGRIAMLTNAYPASFDCRRASTETERMICSDKETAQFDQELEQKYKKGLALVSYKEQMEKQQHDWVEKLRNVCEDELCLRREYRDRIAALNSTIAAANFVRKPEDQKNERDQIIAMAKKLNWEKPPGWKEDNKKDVADKQFCEALLVDLKTGKDIEFLEPIVRTGDYNDPKLQAYLGKCPRLKPFKGVQWQPKVWDMLKEQDYPEEEWEDYGTKYYSSLDFKLYHVDFDGKPGNGREYLFYGGGGYEYEHGGTTTYSEYKIFSLDSCKDLASIQVRETMNSKTKQPTKDKNGVFQYKNKYFVYESVYPDFNYRRIRIYQWNDALVSKTDWICTFHE